MIGFISNLCYNAFKNVSFHRPKMLTIPHPAIHDYSAEWIYQENQRLRPQNKFISASRYALAIGTFDLRDATENFIQSAGVVKSRCAKSSLCGAR